MSITAMILRLTFIVSFPISAAAQPRAEMEITAWIVCHMGDDVSSTTLDGLANEGHAFLVFQNASTMTVTIGRMSVAPGQSISIGTFGNRSTHQGIWYNIEAYLQPENCYAMRGVIMPDYELSLVNEVILRGSNNTYDEDRNSSAIFAQKVWNAISPGMFTGDNTSPSSLRGQMINWGLNGYTVYENYTPPFRTQPSIAYQSRTASVYDPNGATAH